MITGESVPRPLAQVGDYDRGADQDQSRRCLGMRRLQRDDQPDGRADLQTPTEVITYTLYIARYLPGFSFGIFYGLSVARARIWYLASSPSKTVPMAMLIVTIPLSTLMLSM